MKKSATPKKTVAKKANPLHAAVKKLLTGHSPMDVVNLCLSTHESLAAYSMPRSSDPNGIRAEISFGINQIIRCILPAINLEGDAAIKEVIKQTEELSLIDLTEINLNGCLMAATANRFSAMAWDWDDSIEERIHSLSEVLLACPRD